MEKMAHLIPLKVPKDGWVVYFKNKIVSVKDQPHIQILLVILAVASFMRLYRISDYLTFLGDEGRDVLVVRQILEGDLTLLGPRASAGDFFLGPIYYYFMAPFLWLFNYDPVGPAVMVAITGIATVLLMYLVGKEFFSKKAGLFASAVYAVSPLILSYSRSSWNPNVMPFFSLLMLYCLYFAVKKSSAKLFLTSGILYGIAMQLHYIEIVLAPVMFFFVLIASYLVKKQDLLIRLVKNYLAMLVGFVIGWSLFLAFELRHNFQNLRAIGEFLFNNSEASTGGRPFIDIAGDAFMRLFGRLLYKFPLQEMAPSIERLNTPLWQGVILITALVSTFFLIKSRNKIAVTLCVLWLTFGVILFGFYKKPIYDYYFAFMFPLPFLLLGNALSKAYEGKFLKPMTKGLVILFLGWLIYYNLTGAPFLYPANKQKEQMKTISEFVLTKTNGKPFNFALITPGNSDHAYRYYFELAGKPPVPIENLEIDKERKSVTDQLLVVCEISDCHPLGHSLWEVAGFGRGEIEEKWKVSVVEVYRIRHYRGE